MNLTLEELGNIGELIAAIATVATLFYLALQIRQNTHLLRAAELSGRLDDAYRWRAYLIEHKDIAILFRRGMAAYDSLDGDDRLRFRMLLDQLFYAWQARRAMDPQGDFASTTGFLLAVLGPPGGRTYWERGKARFTGEFVEWVEKCLRENGKKHSP